MSRPNPLSDVEPEQGGGLPGAGRTPAVAGTAAGRRWVSRPAAARGFKAPPPPPQVTQAAPEGGGSAHAAKAAASAKSPTSPGPSVVSLPESGSTPAVAGAAGVFPAETEDSSQGTADTASGCDGDVSSAMTTPPPERATYFVRAPSLGLPGLGAPPPPPPPPPPQPVPPREPTPGVPGAARLPRDVALPPSLPHAIGCAATLAVAGAPRVVPAHPLWEGRGFSTLPEEPSSGGDGEAAPGGIAETPPPPPPAAERLPAAPEEATATASKAAVPVEPAASIAAPQPAGADPALPSTPRPPGVFVCFLPSTPRGEAATADPTLPTPAVAGRPGFPAPDLPPGLTEASPGDAAASTPAVAGPQGAEGAASAPAEAASAAIVDGVWTLDDIRWEAPKASQPAALSNTALKWLRFKDEAPEGCPTLAVATIDLDEPNMDIGVLVRDKGPDFSWKKSAGAFEKQPWSWRLFVLGLPEDVQRRVIGNGLCGLTVEATSLFVVL
ncbi:MAG: hypothetical protein GY772_17150 [bacterium]|nr:hypothetical protein [bacterium]